MTALEIINIGQLFSCFFVLFVNFKLLDVFYWVSVTNNSVYDPPNQTIHSVALARE